MDSLKILESKVKISGTGRDSRNGIIKVVFCRTTCENLTNIDLRLSCMHGMSCTVYIGIPDLGLRVGKKGNSQISKDEHSWSKEHPQHVK